MYLSASALHRPAHGGQLGKNQVPVITLNFDNAILYGAARTATLLQLLSQRLEFEGRNRDTRYERNAFATPTLGFQPYPDDAIGWRRRFVVAARTGLYRFLALRADTANPGAVNQR